MPDFLELTENQSRQYIDAQALIRAHGEALDDAAQVRGSMIWRELRGVRYLIRTSAASAQKTIGADSADTQAIYDRFMERKQASAARVKSLTARLEEQRKLNRVYSVGRAPNVIIKVLSALKKAGIASQFLTVGTNAIYAYESACGVRVGTEAMATRDMDLLFDTRQRTAFVSTLRRLDTSLLAVLRKADPTFRVLRDQLQTAVNDDGYEVDIIRRIAKDGDTHPLRMSSSEDDLWAVQVGSGEKMVAGRRFQQLVVAASGQMAMMQTIHPMDFIRIKTLLASDTQRDPLKRPKDKLQAAVVQDLWDSYLQHREAA
ncbi:MAG: GSU2403 family nucleotidyltransferase fold protein [Polaromonas sp.]